MKRKAIDQLSVWKDKENRKPLILKGARQVGKTHLLKTFGATSFPVCHYLNFEESPKLHSLFQEDLSPSRILKELEFFLDHPIRAGQDLLIFDEIQDCPLALKSLKYFAEKMPNLAICAAGSLLGLTLSPDSFPVGKVEFLDLYPLNFEEFLMALEEERALESLRAFKLGNTFPELVHETLWKLLKCYFVVGGLPEVVQCYLKNSQSFFNAVKKVRKIQEDLLRTYLADMAKHSGRENSMHLERLLKNVPEQLAQNQDQSAKKFKFKGALRGVYGYDRLSGAIDWLEAAGLILKTKLLSTARIPLSAFSKENAFKLYLFDVGLLGSMSGLDPKAILNYGFGSYQGFFVENFVAQELVASGKQDLFAWQGRTSEVEFLLQREGKILPLEVKSGWVLRSKSIQVFLEKFPETDYAIILSAQNESSPKQSKFQKMPLYLAGFL